jgi:hypothetical protein
VSFRYFRALGDITQGFLNRIVPFRKNPLLCVFDNFVEAVFQWGTVPHRNADACCSRPSRQACNGVYGRITTRKPGSTKLAPHIGVPFENNTDVDVGSEKLLPKC